jgi:phage terminase large subunit-like protein
MVRQKPRGFPKLKNYVPTRFMAKSSHYDKERADLAVMFIEGLKHTTGKWEGQNFYLLPWQEQIIRDVFGIVDKDGNRQFRQAYIEIPKKNGKSELAAAIALYLLFMDAEPSAEVYGAAADSNQASIVFNVALKMVEQSSALLKRCKIKESSKLIELNNGQDEGRYKVLSADIGTKHGLNISGLIFDEVHTQRDRKFFDVLTKGSGDAREQPLFFYITTAGDQKESICYELHSKAKSILDSKKRDSSFYPVIYGLEMDEDYKDEKNWKRVNPSMGYTIKLDRFKDAFIQAEDNPAELNVFRQLRLNTWVSSKVRWMNMEAWDKCAFEVDAKELEGRVCYGGLDLSSSIDITAFVLVFPPIEDEEKYIILPFFWIPEESIEQRVRRDHVPYDKWLNEDLIQSTDGNVIHYGYIEKFIEELGTKYNIKEIAFDRWGAIQMTQNLEGMGFTVVPFGQGYKDMSPPTKRLMELVLEGKVAHGGNIVLRWMIDNVIVKKDPAGNIKMDKEKSNEKIDGAVATVMALDRAIRCGETKEDSVYDERGIIVI